MRLVRPRARFPAATTARRPVLRTPENGLYVAWPPGNVRELRNVIRRAVLMTSDVVRPEHLAGVYADSLPASSPSAHGASPSGLSLKEIADIAAQQLERQAIMLSPSSRSPPSSSVFEEKTPPSPASTRKAHLRRPRVREEATHMPGTGEGSMRCKVASN